MTVKLIGVNLNRRNIAYATPSLGIDSLQNGVENSLIAYNHTVNGVAYNFRGVWTSTLNYVQGDEVIYGASYWLSLSTNNNSAPSIGNPDWQVVASYNGYQGAWSNTTAYIIGAEVTYSGNFWICVVANTNSAPTTSNSNWQIAGPISLDDVADGSTYARVLASHISSGVVSNFRGTWNSSTAYLKGDEVFYSDVYWLALANSTNSTPTTANTTNWQAVGTYNQCRGSYGAGTAYVVGDEVTYIGNYWVCVVAGTGQTPTVGSSHWTLAGPTSLDYLDDGTYFTRVGSQSGPGVAAITNSLFQQFDGTNFPGWTCSSGGTLTQISTGPVPAYGTYCAKITSTGSSNISLTVNQTFKCKAGDTIQFGGVAYNTSANQARITCSTYTGAGVLTDNNVLATSGTGTWQDLSGTLVATGSAAYYVINVANHPTASGQITCFNEVWATNITSNLIDFSNSYNLNQDVSFLGGVQAGTCYDGQAITFSPVYSSIPLVLFSGGGLTYSSTAGSATNQTQAFIPESLTTAGFTASLKLNTGGSLTAQSVTYSTLIAGSAYYAKITTAGSYNNQYTVNWSLNLTSGSFGTVYIKYGTTDSGGTAIVSKFVSSSKNGAFSTTFTQSGLGTTDYINISLTLESGSGTISASTLQYTTGTSPTSYSAVGSTAPIIWMAYPA